ncbi:MAG: DivIVA domain-containing protein [Acidimicrobiales bacterium]
MPEDHRLAITSQRHVSPDDIARRTFGTVRRGFDPTEVRAFLESVAEALRAAEDRIESLRQQVVEAEDRAAHPVLDEETVASALGAETARVLRTAHEAAHDMVANAEAESERLRTSAHDAAADLEARTEAALAARTSEVEAALAELRHRAEAEAADTAASTRAEAEALLEQTRDECRRMVEEAQALRSRVLADLARRRKALHSQIDQLRAGRERLAETVRDVRRTIDSIAEEIFRAEDEARLAAEAAGRDATIRSGEHAEVDESRTPAAEEPAAEEPAAEEPAAEEPAAEEPAAEEPAATRTPGHTSRTASARSAEAVFAKIRAAREAGGAARMADPAGTSPSPSPSPDDETRLGPDAPDGVASAGTDASGEDPRSAEEEGAEQETARAVAGPPEATPPLALQRDELLAPVITALSRRLKRLLQDEQNDLLDRLRSARSRWSPELLPDADTSGRKVVVASLEHLRAAAGHGASLVVGQVGETDLVGDDLDQVADDLQRAILAPLRRRLESEQTFEPGDERGAAEHVGAAFRIWKAGRVEELATDHVLAAFALGTRAALAGCPDDHALWVAVSGTERPPCPDCEDNALAGPTSVGDVFPTGHRSPPAHPGCRCLLAPAST